LNLGGAWLPLGDNKAQPIQPYVGLTLVPGFFLNGSNTSNYGGEDYSSDVNSEYVQPFLFALRPNIGADYTICPGTTVGLNVGYEQGITNVNKSPENTEGQTKTALWNGITTGIGIRHSF
jgi:hypothetical protein